MRMGECDMFTIYWLLIMILEIHMMSFFCLCYYILNTCLLVIMIFYLRFVYLFYECTSFEAT